METTGTGTSSEGADRRGAEASSSRTSTSTHTHPTMDSSHESFSALSLSSRGKCMDSSDCLMGQDSGFLSGSCTTESELGLSATDLGPSSSSYQRLDSGVDVAEALSGLNLSVPNKLTTISQDPTTGSTFKEYPPWEQFFMPDEDGDTQLHIAVMEGLIDGVFTLISLVPHPSILDFQNDACQTALHLAVLTKQPRLARRLVAAGARVDMRDRFGNTPLHLAAASGDLGSVQALTMALSANETVQCGLRYPAFAQPLPQQLDLLNYEGQGPIHLAALCGHCDVIRALHWLGADLSLADGKGGRSPLHFAVERGHSAAAHALISECGVGLECRTYGGLTPYQLAAESHVTLAQDLLRMGAISSSIPTDDMSGSESESEDSDSDCDVP